MADIVERLRFVMRDRFYSLPKVSLICDAAANEIECLRMRVTALEMVINEEIDAYDCADEANRMIVEGIRDKSPHPVSTSPESGK